MKNKNNSEKENKKDNSFKFQLYSYLNYIYNLFFSFILALLTNLYLISKCNISFIIYIFDYLNFILNNRIKKRNSNNYNDKFIPKYYSKNNKIDYSSKVNIKYKKDYSNFNKKYFILLLNGINYIKRPKNIIVKQIMNKNKYKKSLFYYFSLFIFIINIKILYAYQEINITINGTGKQQIVFNNVTYYNYKPNKILINGNLQNYTDFYVYNLNKSINIITMRWDNKLISCNRMFYKLNNITDINFSNFNTSSVKDMQYMFDGCTSLVSLNLNNFDTSHVENMKAMLSDLYSIKFLDLSNFNTSSVKDMQYMFYGCTSLVSLNLNNFDTSHVEDMYSMFYNLISLTFLDLSNFNTSSVKDMGYMFYGCTSLVSLNLDNFDTSHVEDMRSMFYDVNSLTFLNLSNFNTSSVKNMRYMFDGCTSLISLNLDNFDTSHVKNMSSMFDTVNSLKFLDLSNFNTSSVKDMGYMFYGCTSLVSLNLDNFDTSHVENMRSMFSSVNSLKFLNLSNFNTSSVKNMRYMFDGCTSLVSLNLNNFDTSHVTSFYSMFYNCTSLIYLNLNSFIINKTAEIYYILSETSKNLLLCYDKNTASDLSSYSNKCNSNCFQNEFKLIIDKRICVDKCNNGDGFNYEYKNICFQTCEEISEYLYGNSEYEIYYNYDKTKCIDEVPDGYFLNDSNKKTIDKCNIKCKTCNKESNIKDLCLSCNIKNKYYPILNNNSNINSFIDCFNKTPSGYIFDNFSLSYKPCYPSCKECRKIGDNYNHQCLECIDNYYLNNQSCYKKCLYYFYFNDLHIHQCTEEEKCPDNKTKLIEEKGECTDDCSKDDLYKFEYNNKCYNYYITQESTDASESEKLIIDNYVDEGIIVYEDNGINIEYMRNKLNNSYIKEKELEEIKNGNELILLENNELRISLITSDIKVNQNKNKSIINLRECENKLKDFYNISKNESLLILKVEVIKKDMKKPRIEYEVYYPSNENRLYKLDLNLCEDVYITISNPMKLYDKNIDKYNSSSDFYKDVCYTYTTEKGTDITLNDRKEEYVNNDLDPCEENCNFTEYDYENCLALCSCEVKKIIRKYSEININKSLLYKSFTDIDNIINLNVMKCYKQLFSKNGILYNIGFYIILFIAIFLLIATFIFYWKEDQNMKNIDKISNNSKSENSNKNCDKIEKIKQLGKNYKIKIKKKKMNIENNNFSVDVVQTRNNINQDIIKDLEENSKSIIELKDKTNEINSSEYNIYELNNLEYSDALKEDKRKFFQYYSSILKEKHILFFSFCKKDNFNSRIIKIFLFFYSFVIFFFVNTLFFNDSTMHKIYLDIGLYNLAYQLSQILYSLLISTVLNILIRKLALTEKNIIDLTGTEEQIKNRKKKLIKFLFYKYIIFFIISFCLLLLFWYYISCFCAIYNNTQIHLITDTAISFGLSMVYPLFIYLLAGILRMFTLKGMPSENKKYLYYWSYIIQSF